MQAKHFEYLGYIFRPLSKFKKGWEKHMKTRLISGSCYEAFGKDEYVGAINAKGFNREDFYAAAKDAKCETDIYLMSKDGADAEEVVCGNNKLFYWGEPVWVQNLKAEADAARRLEAATGLKNFFVVVDVSNPDCLIYFEKADGGVSMSTMDIAEANLFGSYQAAQEAIEQSAIWRSKADVIIIPVTVQITALKGD